MKKILTILLLLVIITGCTVQNNIKKVEIKESGYDINVLYDPINEEIVQDGVSYKITPISADELNTFFIQENTYNGKFYYSDYKASRDSYMLVSNPNQPVFRYKAIYDFLVEGLVWLLENDSISKDEYVALSKEIDDYHMVVEEKQEKVLSAEEFNNLIVANPYYIGDKYLNVFKVELSNNNDWNFVLDGNFSVNVGDQLLHSLSNEKIIDLLRFDGLFNQYKYEILERYNLSTPLVIPPKAKFTKYFSVLPYDINHKTVEISNFRLEERLSWNIVNDMQTINEVYTFFVFDIDYLYHETNIFTDAKRFNLVTKGSDYAYFNGNELYIDEDHINSEIEIITVTNYNNRIYYGRNTIKANESISIASNIRYPIILKLIKIDELKF